MASFPRDHGYCNNGDPCNAEPCKTHGTAFTAAATSEWREIMFDAPGIDCNLEREELWPLPTTLPPRTSSEPCWISWVEFSASAAANSKNRE